MVTRVGKREVTHSAVSSRNVRDMRRYVANHEIREGWRQAHHPWERLRWARMHWQSQSDAVNPTAKQAADALGMKEGTYRAYEREEGASKRTRMDDQTAIRFAKKFHVSWLWLLLGHGTPFDEELPEHQGRVLRLMSGMDEGRQKALADMIEVLTRDGGGQAEGQQNRKTG